MEGLEIGSEVDILGGGGSLERKKEGGFNE